MLPGHRTGPQGPSRSPFTAQHGIPVRVQVPGLAVGLAALRTLAGRATGRRLTPSQPGLARPASLLACSCHAALHYFNLIFINSVPRGATMHSGAARGTPGHAPHTSRAALPPSPACRRAETNRMESSPARPARYIYGCSALLRVRLKKRRGGGGRGSGRPPARLVSGSGCAGCARWLRIHFASESASGPRRGLAVLPRAGPLQIRSCFCFGNEPASRALLAVLMPRSHAGFPAAPRALLNYASPVRGAAAATRLAARLAAGPVAAAGRQEVLLYGTGPGLRQWPCQ